MFRAIFWLPVLGFLIVGGVLGSVTAWMLLVTKLPRYAVFFFSALASFGIYFALYNCSHAVFEVFPPIRWLIVLPWGLGFGFGNAMGFIALACQGFITWILSLLTWWIIHKLICRNSLVRLETTPTNK